MRISKYIGDLLFQYECVVIPDFGGFITKEIPAEINPVQHNFSPPSKEIVFNIHLKTNDGLLVNHIALSENISYNESKTRIETFARKCRIGLNSGKKINFHNVGYLFLNENDEVVFKQDVKNNYCADSFGLTSFISPPIKRVSQTKKIERRFKDRKGISLKTNFRKTLKWGSVVLPILALLILGFLNANSVKSFYNNYAQFVPFFYSSPSEYLAYNIVKLPIDKILDNKSEKIDLNKNEEPVVVVEEVSIPISQEEEKVGQLEKKQVDLGTNKSVEPDEVIEKPTEDQNLQKIQADLVPTEQSTEVVTIEENQVKYFIIGGAFEKLSNAEKLVEELKNHGFKSEIVGLNKYGLYRVSYEGFLNKSDASKQLKTIKKENNPSAWIFTK